MKTIIITASLVLVLFMIGTAVADTFTVVLLDCSGSMLQAGSDKDSPFDRNLEELKAEIRRLNKKDSMLVLGFGRKSDVQLLKVEMPRIAGPQGINLINTREGSIKKLMENIRNNTAQIDKSRTDLIGSLSKAARVFSESALAPRRLLLYSDTLDNETLNLSLKRLSAGSYKQFLKRLDMRKIPYPNLQNVTVDIYAVFAGEKDLSGLRTESALAQLKELWSEFFKRSGTRVSSYRTSMY